MKQGDRRLRLVPVVAGIVALLASATPALAGAVSTPIPEPGTLTLVAVGAVGFAVFAARKLLK